MLTKTIAVIICLGLLYLVFVALKTLLTSRLSAENQIATQMAARQFRLLKQIHTAYHSPHEDKPALIQAFKQNLNDFFEDVDQELGKLQEVNAAPARKTQAELRIVQQKQ